MIPEIIKEIQKHENKFVGVAFRNGHLHTIKAYGDIFPSPCEGEFEGQIEYVKFVEENENTDVFDIMTASTMEEAIENDILEENGDIF